ncbi:MAG: hypothetical protein J6B01_04615 [Ruminococcus sp.]|nr:hypothetical protein [Ruminococcus sp.]
MKELMDEFKVDLEKMMDEWYETLEQLVDGALFNMSFFEGDIDEHYIMLQDMMIEVLQERLGDVFKEDGIVS